MTNDDILERIFPNSHHAWINFIHVLRSSYSELLEWANFAKSFPQAFSCLHFDRSLRSPHDFRNSIYQATCPYRHHGKFIVLENSLPPRLISSKRKPITDLATIVKFLFFLLIVQLGLSGCVTLQDGATHQFKTTERFPAERNLAPPVEEIDHQELVQTSLRTSSRSSTLPAALVLVSSSQRWGHSIVISTRQPILADEQFLSDSASLFPRTAVDCLDRTDCTGDIHQIFSDKPRSFLERVIEDHRNYYSPRNLTGLAISFGIGGAIANSQLDQEIHDHFNASVQNAPSDEWMEGFHSPKEFGNGLYTLPMFAAAWGLGSLYDDTLAGCYASEWGERSLRAFAVGAPPVILMQKVTGSGRPEEGDSHWDFWKDNNGVSGHAFMGALPFLTASQTVDEPVAKFLLFAASTAVPLSRVSDGDHFTSQAILGWCMAWSATMAVDATQDRDSNWRTMPFIGRDFSGLAIECRW